MPYGTTNGSNFTSEEKVEQAFKAGLDRVQTDLQKEWFQEPKVIKTILPNQTYKNTIPSWNEIKNYLLIDRVTNTDTPKITTITVDQVLGTASKFKDMRYSDDLDSGKFDSDGTTYVCRPSSGTYAVKTTTNSNDQQYEGLSPGMFTRYNYFSKNLTGGNTNTPDQDEPNNALLTYTTNLDTINTNRIIGNTQQAFLENLELHAIAVDIIAEPSDWNSVDTAYIENNKHPFLQIYLSVPTFSSYSFSYDEYESSDNISFFNPVIENALGDAEGYLYLIEGWNNASSDWNLITTESAERVFFNNTSGIVSVYGQENILNGPKLSGIYSPLVSYIKYTGETLADGIISQGATLPNPALHNEKDLFINTTENKIYRLNSDKNWILIGGSGDIITGDGISKVGDVLSLADSGVTTEKLADNINISTTGTISSTGDNAKLTIRHWHINGNNDHLNFNYDSDSNSVDGSDNFVFQIDKDGQLRMPCIHTGTTENPTISKKYFLWHKSCDSNGSPQLELGISNTGGSFTDDKSNVLFKIADTIFNKRIWAYNTDVMSTHGFKIWRNSNENTSMSQGSTDGITTFNLKTQKTEGSFELRTTTTTTETTTNIAKFKTTDIEFFQPLHIRNNLQTTGKITVVSTDESVVEGGLQIVDSTSNARGIRVYDGGNDVVPIRIGTHELTSDTTEPGTNVIFTCNSSSAAQNVKFRNYGSTSINLRLQNSEGEYGIFTNADKLGFYDYTRQLKRYELDSAGNHDFKDGNIASGPIVVAQPAGNQATMTFQRNQTSFGFIKFKHVSGNDGDLCIGSHDKGLRFLSDAIVPQDMDTNAGTDNVISLGTSGARFKDLHLGGTVNCTGLTVGSGDIKTTGALKANRITDNHWNNEIRLGDFGGNTKFQFEDGTYFKLAGVAPIQFSHSYKYSTGRNIGKRGVFFQDDEGMGCEFDWGYFRDEIRLQGSILSSSDERVKSNIQTLDPNQAKDMFDQIEPKTYDRTFHGDESDTVKKRVGFIAQDVTRMFESHTDPNISNAKESFVSPEIYKKVRGTEDNQEVICDIPDFQSLDYSRMVTILWGTVKHMEAHIQKLETQLASV